MKNHVLRLLIIALLFQICCVSAEEETPTKADAAQNEEQTSDVLPAWSEVMRIYLDKFGTCHDKAEADAILSSRAIDPNKPMIALTFDDGPVAGVTDFILDILEENNARATFFLIGARLKKEENCAILPHMLAIGCEIGNHTYNHDRLKNYSGRFQKKTEQRVNDAVFEITGFKPTSLRPPGGMTGNMVIKYAGEIGMSVILWSQSGNVHETRPQKIADNVLKQSVNGRELQNGDIILLHDTKPSMVEAMRILVPELIESGYQLVTVRELLEYSAIGYQSGYQYRSIEEFKTYD